MGLKGSPSCPQRSSEGVRIQGNSVWLWVLRAQGRMWVIIRSGWVRAVGLKEARSLGQKRVKPPANIGTAVSEHRKDAFLPWGVAQMGKCLPSPCEALALNHTAT